MPPDPAFRLESVRVSDWPGPHQLLWWRAQEAGGLFDEPGGAAKWKPTALAKTAKGYGIWLHWYRTRWAGGGNNIASSRPSDLVTRETVRAYHHDLTANRSSGTVCNHVQELYDAVRVMEPAVDWRWLAAAFRRSRSNVRPTRDKHSRLRTLPELERLGRQLMADAEEGGGLTELQRALAFRDGLMIALMARTLLRISNFMALELGRSLLVEPDVVTITFPASEMKGKRAMMQPFPPSLLAELHRYLKVYRPVLLTTWRTAPMSPTSMLWVSREGTALSMISLHNAFRRRTKQAFGKPIPPHWFRDAGATLLVRDDPGSARLVSTLLDHHDPRVAEKHYNQAKMVESARRYASVIENLMCESRSDDEEHGQIRESEDGEF